MSRFTEYIKEKEDKFLGLDLIYNDLGVTDFLDTVNMYGLEERKSLSMTEVDKEVSRVSLGASKKKVSKISLGSGEKKENKVKIKRKENNKDIGKGLEDFLGNF